MFIEFLQEPSHPVQADKCEGRKHRDVMNARGDSSQKSPSDEDSKEATQAEDGGFHPSADGTNP